MLTVGYFSCGPLSYCKLVKYYFSGGQLACHAAQVYSVFLTTDSELIARQ